MNRTTIELFRLTGLVGCVLSLAGLVLVLSFRIETVVKQHNAGPDVRHQVLQILDAFKEPGVPFLLSALLAVVSGIGLNNLDAGRSGEKAAGESGSAPPPGAPTKGKP
jgi:hypothetical protein